MDIDLVVPGKRLVDGHIAVEPAEQAVGKKAVVERIVDEQLVEG